MVDRLDNRPREFDMDELGVFEGQQRLTDVAWMVAEEKLRDEIMTYELSEKIKLR